MNELHEKCKRKAEYVRLYRQQKKADASSVDERIRNAERVTLHRKRFYIFDHTTERGITERCSVILHHIHYSCRLKCNFCTAFCSQDMNLYLVFSAFTSRPIPLLATNKASVLSGVFI
jgi:hypothetical protein